MRADLGLGIALVACTAWLAACGGSSSSPNDLAPAEIIASERTLVDASRPTMPNGTYAGAADRTLETRLWYLDRPLRGSAACGRNGCGLVVMAHGYGGFTGRFDRFARGLAEQGYIVAALTFPLTNQSAPGGLQITDFVNQPADVSFVIDRLLAASEDRDDELFGRIDPGFIALVGHSLGGATVIANTRLSVMRDPRITAVVGVAPAIFIIPGLLHETPIADGPPILVIQGTADIAVSYDSTVGYFADMASPKAFVGLTGASHVDAIEADPYPGTFIPQAVDATLGFFESVQTGRSDALLSSLERLEAEGHTTSSDL